MKTIKPQKLGVLCRTFEANRRIYLVVTLLLCVPLDAPRSVLTEVEMWKRLGPELGEGGALDDGWSKARGEVLVTGRCFTPGGAARPVSYVRVRLGAVEKRLAVVGDRVWKDGVPTAPVPFTEMPVDYAHAFGGEGYPQNPLGKGVPLQGSPAHALPNVELPDRLITSPKDRPPPAGLGAYALDWPQRLAKAGTYDREWLTTRSPGLARDTDPAFFNAAPEDQQIAGYFGGDERFEIENMHPTKPWIEGRLPGLVTRAFVTRKTAQGESFHEIATRLDTVRFFPRVERAVLVHRGMIEIAEDDAADVLHLIAACEDPRAPRQVQHYRDVLAARLDRTRGLLASLRDADLMPASGGHDEPPAPKSDVTDMLAGEGLLRGNMHRRAEAEIAAVSARLEAQGLRPADHGVAPLPPAGEPPDVDDPDAFIAFVENQQALAEEQRAAAAVERARQEETLRATCAKQGVDFDAVLGKGGGGPPTFSAEVELRKVPMPTRIADPGIEKKLQVAEETLHGAYRLTAHLQPRASALEEAAAKQRGAALRAAVANGERVAGRDFTGADLSKQDLRGANLRGVFLEGANLSGADLSGANLTEAVLARADLLGAKLAAAKLRSANLGGARAHGADLSGADLSRAILAKAELDGARFRGATLEGVDFMETVFGAVDLGGAQATGLRILRGDLSRARLAGAKLTKSLFLEVDVTGTDFSGAELGQATFVTCKGEGAAFRRASLKRAVIVHGSSFPGADFREAILDGANLRGTCLDGCGFEGARLAGADLSECSLQGARFAGAAAPSAMMVRADLTGAKMAGIDLMNAVLQKAKLRGADLTGANLFRADLSRARFDRETKLDRALLKQARVDPRSADGPK